MGTTWEKSDKGRHNMTAAHFYPPGMCISCELCEQLCFSFKSKGLPLFLKEGFTGNEEVYQQIIHKMWKTYVNENIHNPLCLPLRLWTRNRRRSRRREITFFGGIA